MPADVRLTLSPVPTWLDLVRWLGTSAFTLEPLACGRLRVTVQLPAAHAADLMARQRGLGLDGRALELQCEPPLSRALVRAGRLRDARARRETTPGFVRAGATATGEGRYSLTPESLALAVGKVAAGRRVLDACCGAGGSAIGFARAGCTVHALECDRGRLADAARNADVYGVGDRITFELADACVRVAELSADVLFVDPPWGEHYDKQSTRLPDFPLLASIVACPGLGARFGELWAKVPSSFEVASLAGAVPSAWFGTEPGDAHRIKFVLLRLALARNAGSVAADLEPSSAPRR